MFDVFEQNAVGLIGPMLREQWGISVAQIGFLNTLTFSAAALGRIGSGYIADRYGRRTMLSANLLLFTLGAIICALAPNYAALAAGRFIVGIGLGGEISIAVTMLAELCSTRFRGTAVGLVSVGSGGFGNMLAPAFGLAVFAMFPGPDSWRWLFACLVLPAFFVVFYRRLFRRRRASCCPRGAWTRPTGCCRCSHPAAWASSTASRRPISRPRCRTRRRAQRCG